MVSYQEDFNAIPCFCQDENDCLEGHSPFEILLGKEKAVFNHAGNKRFRAIINHNVDKYMNALSKPDKSNLVCSVYNAMKKAGYRVRKRAGNSWFDIEDHDAREKLSHALRDRVREKRKPAYRRKQASEGVFPMIISMGKALSENQELLNQDSKKLSIKSECSNATSPNMIPRNQNEITAMMNSNKSILDIIDSIPTHDSLSGYKRILAATFAANGELQEEPTFKRRRSTNTVYDFAKISFEEPNTLRNEPRIDQSVQYASNSYETATKNNCCQNDEYLYSIEPVPIREKLHAPSLENVTYCEGSILKADLSSADDCSNACIPTKWRAGHE